MSVLPSSSRSSSCSSLFQTASENAVSRLAQSSVRKNRPAPISLTVALIRSFTRFFFAGFTLIHGKRFSTAFRMELPSTVSALSQKTVSTLQYSMVSQCLTTSAYWSITSCTTDDHDIMGVIANGTAVTIQSTLKEPAVPVKINVINYNPDLEFRVSSLTILPDTEKSTITATLFGKSSENITGLLADIFLVDIFDELHPVHYTGFSRFDVAQNFATSISTPVPCSLELNILPLIKCAKVVIKKYISDNTVITASDNNSLLDIEQEDILENSNDNIFSNYKLQLDEYMDSVCHMNSATEILHYTKNLIEENHDFIQADLIQLISSCASLERMYGNCKNDCIEKIKTYFDSI